MSDWGYINEQVLNRLRRTGLYSPVTAAEVASARYPDHPRWDLLIPSGGDMEAYRQWVQALQDAVRPSQPGGMFGDDTWD